MINADCHFVSYFSYPDNYTCEKHSHPCTEIILNELGEGKTCEQNNSWEWTHNTVYIYQPGPLHWVENRLGGSELCIGTSGLGIEKIPAGVFQAQPSLVNLFTLMKQAVQSPSPLQKERIELYCAMICLEIVESRISAAGETPVSTADIIRETIDYRFNKKISLSELASGLYISKDYLRQVFRKEYGLSPMRYMIQKRIEHACHLLKGANMSISEVAQQCGFDDPYYFSRLFKKIMGVPPTKYNL